MDGPGSRNPRPYGLPSGPAQGLPQGLRPGRPPAPPPHANSNSFTAMSPPNQSISSPQNAKAEQFHDEAKRIIASLFTKLDPDGRVSEQYITHIRIVEDARYPTTPPPPDSGPDNKKDRVILLTVRSTGRVRMHKARENPNGTFSIGKTWNFEELSAIESYGSRQPRNEQEAQWFKWAGETGFAVTLLKPYFWQTNSLQEKSYFIASLAKIYKRYTAGQLPELVGFTATELEQIQSYADQPSGSTAQRPPSRQAGPLGAGRGRGAPSPDPAQQRPVYSPEPSFSGSADSPSMPAPLNARRSPYNSTQDLRPSQPQPPDALRAGSLRQMPSREPVRPYGSSTPPNRLTPQSSNSELPPGRDSTPDSLRAGNNRRGGGFFQGQSETTPPREPASTNGLGITHGFGGARKPNGDISSRHQQNGSTESLPKAAPAPIPERKRPPLLSSDSRYPPEDDRSAIPKPLSTGRIQIPESNKDKPLIEPPLKSPQRFAVGAPQLPPLKDISAAPPGPDLNKSVEPPKKEEEKAPPAEEKNEEDPEELRPGLGRMFGNNKKTTRELFAKAATTYTAFKPRAGGAAAKLFATEIKSSEPDGITGVVPAPNLLRTKTSDSTKSAASGGSIQVTPTSAIAQKKSLPDLTVTSPISPAKQEAGLAAISKAVTEQPPKMSGLQLRAAELQQKSKAAEEEAARRKLRRTPQQIKYLEHLGVDTGFLEGRGLEYEVLLEEFWPQNAWHEKSIETLQAEVRRELSRVQTGSWFEHIALHDEGRNAAIKLVDSAIEECEQLEKLLTIYSVELGSLSDDIAYIEAQGQGLQVQTSNQKLLMSELQGLLDTVNINTQQLDPIFTANVISIEGLESTERAVLSLYKALSLTDPTIKQNNSSNDQPAQVMQLSKMRALQDKRSGYLEASDTFIKRFKNYMNVICGQTIMEMQASAKKAAPQSSDADISVDDVNAGRAILWKYSPLVLYTKSLDRDSWLEIIKSYQTQMRTLYLNGITVKIQTSKKLARGSPGDEQLILFTSDTQADSTYLNSRKITVKRSQTLARTLRNASGEKTIRQAGSQAGAFFPCEAVEQTINEVTPLLLSEQMFLVDFFHANTTETMDFSDAVQSSLPENRRGPLDLQRKPYEPDQDMTQLLADIMTDLFSFLPNELQSLITWATNMGPLQGIGILSALHSKMATIDDGFYFRTLHTLSTRLTNEWSRFLGQQIRAIEETKVKVNKRKGILHFMRIFPMFAAHVESMLPPANTDPNEVRTLVDQAYQQITKAMFDSLRTIAKESPSSAPHAPSSDPEDKEALNYHILLIENMNHYVENVDERGDKVLEEGKNKAREDYEDHLSLYVDAVIRRPLGKIMDFTESLSSAADSPTPASNNPNLSPTAYRKLLAAHDPRELRRGVDALRKRVDKHFGDTSAEDQEQGSGGDRSLVTKVLAACEERYVKEIEKMKEVPAKVYGDETIQSTTWSVSKDDVGKWFKGGR